MDEKWMEQAGQDRMMVEDQAWLLKDWVAKRTEELQRKGREEEVFPRKKFQVLVQYPALLIFPWLLVGFCLWVFVLRYLGQ